MAENNVEKKLTDKDLKSMYWRSTTLLGSFNFERMQSMGFCVTMIPAIKRLYSKKEDQAAALKRHLEFFNTQPWIGSTIMGVTAAMEQEKANGVDIDDATISGIKVGLMGPLAGVGDPIFWGTLRPVLAALGASLAIAGGNLLGPLIFFIGINIARVLTRWYGLKYGYEKGTEIVGDMEGGVIQKLTQGASILGLFVMGALVSKWTSINVPLVLSKYTDSTGKEVVTTVQSILDSLLPGLLALLLTFGCMHLLKRKSKCYLDYLRILCNRNNRILVRNFGIIMFKKMISKVEKFVKVPPKEGYIKNSSILVTGLMIIGMILYPFTKGYGTIIALAAALIVMVGQKLLIKQAKNDFRDMYYAKDMYLKTKNTEYLDFITARSKQMTNDVKVLSERAKKEIAELIEFVKKYKK